LYRGRHYYLCFNQKYRGYLGGSGKLAREDLVSALGARSDGEFDIPPMIRTSATDPFVINHESHQEEV
jgi:hypothetical protein